MTTIATIVKANATTLTTACGIVVESTSKGVPGQFDKLIGLINQAPEDKDLIIEASLLKGVFKALGEDSKDASTFKCVLSLKGWSLMQVADDWTIYRGNGTGIVLTKNTYNWETQEEVEEMVDYSHEYVPTRWEQVVADELGVAHSKLPEPVYPVVPYTGPVVLPTVIQLGVVYSTLNVDTDQGTKICKFLYTPTGVVTCKGNHFESVEALINAVQAAFKLETQEVSETTQEDIIVKPKTFCQLLREEWLPSRESWVIDTLKRKMRATWKARKELTCERQGKFMAEFFRRLDVYSPNTELPLQAFLTTYDLVKEDMTGQKTQIEVPVELKPVQKDHNTEEVKDAYTSHLNNLLNKFPDRSSVIDKEIVHLEETQEELGDTNEPEEELSEGKVTIKSMLGDIYTIEVFFNRAKTLWINTKSGESFNSLLDLCMVHDKEYFNHELFVEGRPSTDTIAPQYQLGDILAVTYDDEHNEYAYYGSDFITVKAVVVEGGFQLGEGEDAEVFATIHELCYKASNGNYEGTPNVRVVTAEEIEAIIFQEYNIGMGIE